VRRNRYCTFFAPTVLEKPCPDRHLRSYSRLKGSSPRSWLTAYLRPVATTTTIIRLRPLPFIHLTMVATAANTGVLTGEQRAQVFWTNPSNSSARPSSVPSRRGTSRSPRRNFEALQDATRLARVQAPQPTVTGLPMTAIAAPPGLPPPNVSGTGSSSSNSGSAGGMPPSQVEQLLARQVQLLEMQHEMRGAPNFSHYQDPASLLKVVDPSLKPLFIKWQRQFKKFVQHYLESEKTRMKYEQINKKHEIMDQLLRAANRNEIGHGHRSS